MMGGKNGFNEVAHVRPLIGFTQNQTLSDKKYT